MDVLTEGLSDCEIERLSRPVNPVKNIMQSRSQGGQEPRPVTRILSRNDGERNGPGDNYGMVNPATTNAVAWQSANRVRARNFTDSGDEIDNSLASLMGCDPSAASRGGRK